MNYPRSATLLQNVCPYVRINFYVDMQAKSLFLYYDDLVSALTIFALLVLTGLWVYCNPLSIFALSFQVGPSHITHYEIANSDTQR